MKINKQVTDVEHILSNSDSIVSNTDLKGVITYANDTFVRISGYSREELIGASHNIVRHPDMPPEAFADLWRSMKAGRPWTGIVKNRCKNGDYYWVLANAAPIHENNQVVGYMSVRSKADHQQIQAVDSAYRLFREGKAHNLKIQDGKIVEVSWRTPFCLLKDCNIKSRLLATIGLLSVLMLAIGGVGLFAMSKAKEGLHSLYEESALPISQIAAMQKLLLLTRLNIAASLAAPTPEAILENTAEVERNLENSSRLWDEYRSTPFSQEADILAEQLAEHRQQLVADGLKPAIAALRAHDMAQAKVMADNINHLYPRVGDSLQQLMQLQLHAAGQVFSAAQSRYESLNRIAISLIAAGIALILWQGLALIRVIIYPLEVSIAHFRQIAQGNYHTVIEIERRNEVGKVMEAIKSMQTRLGFDVAEARRIADENLLVKNALDNVSTGVMIADNKGTIIYVNKSVCALLGKAEADIRKELPNFSVDTLLGSRIDGFHKNYAHQQQLLASLTDSYGTSLELGKRSMMVTVNPVINKQGQRLGSVVEWQDRTAEVSVEKEVSTIVVASSVGDFTKRFDLRGKAGFLRELGEGLNQTLYTSETGLNEVARVLGALSRGDLTETIGNDYQGAFGQLKDDANTTVDKLKGMIKQIKDATHNINTGAKEIALGNNDLSYRTEQQAARLEETAASMLELTSTVQANTGHAKQANRLVIDASGIANRGEVIVGQVVATMDELNDASHKIAAIISVIDDIAFQTNILAFNAAVEAARAGEYGHGFAVVAAEVRHLAQRAAVSAGEIKSLIEDSVKKINGGSKLAAQANASMGEILGAILGVTGMMSDIATASVEQSAGIEQINQAISQIDEMTQQNAALVEQAATAAESLEEQTKNLAMAVDCFRLDKQSCHAALKGYQSFGWNLVQEGPAIER